MRPRAPLPEAWRSGTSYVARGSEPFVHALAADANAVSDAELTILFEGSWRERRTVAWLAAVSCRDHFRERLGAPLLKSELCCAGGAYCMALASFGAARDADLLAVYLARYLRRPDLAYDQPTAMGALAYTDSVLHGDRVSHFLQEGGLWPQWFQDAPPMHGDDVLHHSLIRSPMGWNPRDRKSVV